jgi:phage shock protein E
MSRNNRSVLFAFALTAFALAPTLAACGGPPPPVTDASHAHVDGSKAKKLVADGAKLVDVRGADEYATKHIDGAVSSPVELIGEDDFGGNKDQPIVLYCDKGNRAARAAATLRAKGFTHVYELGGMSNWDK